MHTGQGQGYAENNGHDCKKDGPTGVGFSSLIDEHFTLDAFIKQDVRWFAGRVEVFLARRFGFGFGRTT